jgi:hypothetical protein
MTRTYKFIFISILIAASLACGLITNPINGAQNLASTAQAIASSMPIETLQAIASSMPIETLQAIATSMPDVNQYLNPTGAPVSEWNTIPVMPQATAGQEFNKNTYSYKASGITESDVQTFYNDKLKALGWTSPFSAQGGSSGGIMLFTKDSSVLSITVTTVDQNMVVLLLMQ